MKKPLHITIPITKVDEEQRMVYGYATVEELDSHGEIITYEASKKAFSNWIGNIREMHKDIAVGKAIDIEFDDDAKGVWLGAHVSESTDGENAWIKVKEGVLAGFSIGGRVNDARMEQMMIDGKKKMVNVITDYDLGETSLVDNPAVASATFQIIKSQKGGGLIHREKMIEKDLGRPVAWWEKQFQYSNSQNIMKGSVMVYNENSMGKQDTIAKSLWEGTMLADLAMCLSDYIFWQSYDGEKDLSALKSALEAIQEAAAQEILEPEQFPDYEESIANAAKALNIKKSEELTKMADKVKDRAKSVTGAEDRDANAAVVTSAEDNGRPVNDTEERAAEAGVPVAGSEVEQEVIGEDGEPTGEKETVKQPLVNSEGEELVEVDEEGNPVETEEKPADEEVETPEDAEEEEPAPADEEGKDSGKGKGKQKKFAPKATIQKSTEQSDLAKMVASAVADGIAKAVEPLKEEIASLKKQPAASKVRKTYTVKKGEDVENPTDPDPNSEEGQNKKKMDELLKRADELAKDPSVGTHEERLKVAFELRKYSRLLDPASRAKHAAVRATFGGR